MKSSTQIQNLASNINSLIRIWIEFLNEPKYNEKREIDDVLTKKKIDEDKAFNQVIEEDIKND